MIFKEVQSFFFSRQNLYVGQRNVAKKLKKKKSDFQLFGEKKMSEGERFTCEARWCAQACARAVDGRP
jgi:hypothetical protein